MMSIVLLSFFSVLALASVFFWVYLWQLKEYRFDRLFVHIRDTKQGKEIFSSPHALLLFLGLSIAILSIFFDSINTYFSSLIMIIFFLNLCILLYQFSNKKIKHPVFTMKAIGISLLSLLLILFFVVFPLTDFSLWLLVILFLIPLIVAFVVFLFAFPTEIYTDIYIQKATKWRKKFPHLQVIAVSGSYGKSSTKEIIAQVLSKKFHVVKTALSNNTPLVIARTILDKINSSTDFFIVELGAYKKGEIRQLADMVGPTISVTTAVSDQHLALYGSMKDVIESELELIQVLPKNAPMLLNGNSQGVLEMAKHIRHGNIFWYHTHASHIVATSSGTGFEYTANRTKFSVQSPLLGKHTAENMIPAIFLGLRFGMSPREIQQEVKYISPLPKTIEKKILPSGIIAIDDSFNASPESVASSLEFLSLFNKKKFIVLSPLIELGKEGKKRHKEIGEKLIHVDGIFLTNKNFLGDIQQGLRGKKGKGKIITGSYQDLARKIIQIARKGDAVVFEGKEAGIVLKYLL